MLTQQTLLLVFRSEFPLPLKTKNVLNKIMIKKLKILLNLSPDGKKLSIFVFWTFVVAFVLFLRRLGELVTETFDTLPCCQGNQVN